MDMIRVQLVDGEEGLCSMGDGLAYAAEYIAHMTAEGGSGAVVVELQEDEETVLRVTSTPKEVDLIESLRIGLKAARRLAALTGSHNHLNDARSIAAALSYCGVEEKGIYE